MRSAEPRTATLAGRLTRTLVCVSALAAMLATVAALLLADAMLRDRVESSVMAAASVLAVEVDEAPSLIGEAFEPEARELGIDGKVAIVDANARVLAGQTDMVAPTEPCAVMQVGAEPGELFSRPGHREFVCRHVLTHDPQLAVLVAVPATRLDEHRPPMLIAGLGVLALVAIGSAIVGLVLARRLLIPLEQLRLAVAHIDERAPAAVRLPDDLRFAELDALRDSLAQLLTRLDHELARTARFNSAAAHELRTPLAKMRTELELELEDMGPNPRATFERLHRITDHLVSLSERLLTLATPGEALACDRATSLASLAEALVERRSPEDAARLSIVTGEADGLVRGDEVLLAAMIDNVVDNALKFSSGPVRVAVIDDGHEIEVCVDDEGPGVPDELASVLFEPFQRSVAARALPGVGLGLAVVAHIATAYGGRVGFVGGRERGARIVIRLPRVSDDG